MIKELDNQGQEKITPRKLFNEEAGGAGSDNSQASPSAEKVGGYSSDGSSRSRSQGRSRFARKHQKNISRNKGISKSHRSVRSEARSRSKSKSVKSKPQPMRASQRKSNSDSGYDIVSDSGSKDLSMPYRRPKPIPFTSRITRFRYYRRAKLPPNVRLYEWNKDPKDHLSIFSVAAEQKEWPMPVWCKMFCQTLTGLTRNWFDSMDPKSIDGFKELSNKFLEEFSQQKRYDKDPTKIHGIKRKPNEGLQAFMDRFKSESDHIKGVPPVLRISVFMHGHGHPELAKKLNDKISKTVDEMWERVRAIIREETVSDTIKVIRTPRREKSAGKASWSKNQNGSRNRGHRRGEGRSMGTYAPYARREGFTPLTKTPKEIFAINNVNFPPPPLMVGTLEKRSMNKFCNYHQDRGHNTNDYYHLKKKIEEAMTLGRLAHLMKDIMVRRIHVDGGSSSEVMYEKCFRNLSYRTRSRLKEFRIPVVGFSGELNKGKKPSKSNSEEKIVVNDNYPEQLVTIGGGLSTECRQALIHTLRKNVDIFAQTLADMMGIPRAITEHNLDTYPHIEPKVQKKRSLTSDGRKVVTMKLMNGSRLMTKKDDEKTAFHMEEGVFCYTKMPFGLKNARATYQRLVDFAFKEQIGVNLKAYANEMVIKSRNEQDIIKDVEQTFSTLRRINMKLNPKKCSFGMEEGKFLGYIVTSKGIRANLQKTKAIMDMPSPRTLKQMQSLNTLKKCTNKKEFRWTEAAEAAFLEMKKLVSELPTLTTPKKGETLMRYLAAANEAVSAVLLTKREGRQMPIHYVSRSLHGAETNCASMEKLALALVHVARWLRRYFQAHPIKVITDSLIRQVLNNSGASRRLAKWAVELGAYGITYLPRVAVKGQVLADFLADTPTEINATPDVASTPRAEDILIALEDMEYSYVLCLNFSNSNNDAEYEALLVGLQIATKMQVKDIHAFVDSKLVASRVEGSYEAKGKRMIKYQEKVFELAGAFNRFRITHIPRVENKKADALSKLAEVQFDHLSKEVPVEVMNVCSVEAQEVNMVVEEEGPTWMTSIQNYLEKRELPKDPVDARTLMEKNENYTIEDRVVAKAMNLGCFWSSMHRDARELIRACDDCQAHASVPRLPKADMILVTSAWPFMKWGIDIVGPLPEGPGRVKYLIVATDYFTKWMEAKPLATITEIGMPTHRTSSVNEKINDQELRLNRDMLDERREITAIREAMYKHQVENYYNKKVRHVQFKVGEFVLRINEVSRDANTGKLGPT
uniref:Reverse transcriptase domain-containing protein n=1 Tax=Tanacetum cinerariifolium TaxID=118510 RepID=A0A6L2P3J2_TANCI|nr:reverse transcriptase domain-containing protein [Tanacetum cinerariifolium]